jgi:hypothetical protein
MRPLLVGRGDPAADVKSSKPGDQAPRKNNKRRVNLAGQDPIEVLKQILDTPPTPSGDDRETKLPNPPEASRGD